jgi:hypothetical protein
MTTEKPTNILSKLPTEMATEKSTKNAPKLSPERLSPRNTLPKAESREAEICICNVQSGFPRGEARSYHGEYDHLLYAYVLDMDQ